ncbi:GLPGLI family protein [Gynurincola endophyticus]|uniref:GLPGLI family protein n=1 Tax=Gynurincola endophyticus TaxID=2479004 RepID=UPI000F8D4070|nr:GLPGLI family protein [Gynurincola endophyticus]
MKRIALLTSALFCIYSLKAQTVENGLAYVKYHIKFVNDTTNKTNFYETNIYTVIGKEFSLYTLILPKEKEPTPNKGNSSIVTSRSMAFVSGSSPIVEPFYYKFKSNELMALGQFGSEFTALVDERPTKWNITEEKKEIGGYESKKATISWKGRDYEVWFTEELPFTTGPWKFTGLPGLVLEVTDKSGDISITYEGFDMFDEPRPLTIFQGTPKTVSYKIFLTTKEKFQDNTGAYLESLTSGNPNSKIMISSPNGGDSREISIDEMKAIMKQSAEEDKKRNNNRIEL